MKKITLIKYIQKLVDKKCKVSTVSYKFTFILSYDQKFELIKEEVKFYNKLTTHLFIRYMNNSKWNWYND